MDKKYQDMLKIPAERLEAINAVLLDPNSKVMQGFMDVVAKYGTPEETLRRPVSEDSPPFEVWKYSRPRQLKYVFLDETGLGNYQLIYTNDRLETSRADWTERLGPRAVEDVLRF